MAMKISGRFGSRKESSVRTPHLESRSERRKGHRPSASDAESTWREWRKLANLVGSPSIHWNSKGHAVGTVSMYPTVTYSCLNSFRRGIDKGGQILCIATSDADELVHVGTDGPEIHVWRRLLISVGNVSSGSPRVTAILVSDDWIFTAHGDLKVRAWRRHVYKKTKDRMALATRDSHVIPTMWDSVWVPFKHWISGRGSHTVVGDAPYGTHGGPITSLSRNKKFLYTASEDGTVKVWKLSTYHHVETLVDHAGPVNAVLAAGSTVFTASDDCTIKVWRTERGKLPHVAVATLRVPSWQSRSPVKCLALTIDRGGHTTRIYGGMHDGDINMWEMRGHVGDDKHVDSDQALLLVDAEHRAVLRGHNQSVLCIMNLPGWQNFICSGSADCTIRIWVRKDKISGYSSLPSFHVCVQVIRPNDGPVKTLACIAGKDYDCCYLYSGTLDGILRLWRLNAPI